LQRATAELTHAEDHLKRVEPLLPEGFRDGGQGGRAADQSRGRRGAKEQARTSVDAANAVLREALGTQASGSGDPGCDQAQHVGRRPPSPGERPSTRRAQDTLVRSYVNEAWPQRSRPAAGGAGSRVLPRDRSFSGRVVNLNISGARFARAGVDVFTLVDTGTWYVMANFRETQLRQSPGSAGRDLPPVAAGETFPRHSGGSRWAVLPERWKTSVMGFRARESIDWVRRRRAIPVRIKVENRTSPSGSALRPVVTVREQGARSRDGR